MVHVTIAPASGRRVFDRMARHGESVDGLRRKG
jgi:hypothetical protein